jgi:4-hydroxy-tetrahydrodipicolinate reductase
MHALAIFGVTGRMGQSVLRALRETPAFTLSGAIAAPSSARLGSDAAAEGPATGVLITADTSLGIRGATVAIDFSSGGAAPAHAQACAAARIPILVGATGLDAAGRGVLERAAQDVAVLIAPNTSVAVSVMVDLVSLAARRLGLSYDVEIHEAHHHTKRDAPSGTALVLGRAVAEARGVSLNEVAISSLRAGDIVGEHTVMFATAGERLEIAHRATDRITFAQGALRAAEWLVGRPAGLYGMREVLGL